MSTSIYSPYLKKYSNIAPWGRSLSRSNARDLHFAGHGIGECELIEGYMVQDHILWQSKLRALRHPKAKK